MVPALLFGSRFGLIGIAWAHAIVALVDTLVRLTVARRFVGVTFADIGRQLLPSLTAGGVLLAVAIPTAWATRDLGDLTSLVAITMAGAGAYLVTIIRVDRSTVSRLAGFVGMDRFNAKDGAS